MWNTINRLAQTPSIGSAKGVEGVGGLLFEPEYITRRVGGVLGGAVVIVILEEGGGQNWLGGNPLYPCSLVVCSIQD